MEEKDNKLKHRLAFGLSVSLFLVFSLLIFGPLSLYISGSDDLWFSFNALLLPVLIVSGIALVVLTLVTSLPTKKFHKILCCLVFGIALGLYIQGNFFNIRYGSGVLDGSKIVWADYTTYGAIDSAMWAACLALPFAFVMVFKKHWRKILMGVSAAIVLIQVITLSTLIIQNNDKINKITYDATREGIYDLSNKDNTLVFVLDTLDEKYYQNFKNTTTQDYETKLAGFTEYTNTLSTGARTIIGLPAMLTGEPYKKDKFYSKYIEDIWDKDTIFDMYDEKGVDARVFTDSVYFGKGAVNTVKNVVDKTRSTESYKAMTKTMYKYTIYSYFPHYLKKYFWLDTADFNAYKGDDTYSSANDPKFYREYFENDGFKYTDEYDSAVRIYHLAGAHAPFSLDKNGEKTKNSTVEDQIEGEFLNVFKMLDDLREDGKYKDANIIITADHGDYMYGQYQILLVKESGSDTGYETNDASMTTFDLPSTLASYVTDDYKSYSTGITFDEASKNEKPNRARYFYLNTGDNAESRIEEYKCTTHASKKENLKLVDCYYVNGGKINDYKLGSELSFTGDDTATMYCTEGFGHSTGFRTPLRGPHSQMVIPIDKIPGDVDNLNVYFEVFSIGEKTPCTITANGKEVFNQTLSNSLKTYGINLKVPISLIGDDNTLTLDFDFPDIDESEYDLDTNERTITISFTKFKIYAQ